jgi:hypothetical protein
MDTVWERLGGREFSLPLLFPSYFSDSPPLQSMPCWGKYFSKLGVIRNFTVKKLSVIEHHFGETYSYTTGFALVGRATGI